MLIIMRPTLWTNQLLSYFNSQLETRYKLEIQAERLTGNILNQLSGDNVSVTTVQDSVLFTANSLTLRYSLWKVIIGEFAIDAVHIDQPVVYYNEGLDLLTQQVASGDLGQATQRQPFTIERLSINEGQFVYGTGSQQVNVSKITGKMHIDQDDEALAITGDFSSIEAIRPAQQLRSIKFLIHQYPDSIQFNNVEFMYDSAFVLLNGQLDLDPETHLELNYQTSNLSLGSILPQFGITYLSNDEWDIKGRLDTDFTEFDITTEFDGNLNASTPASGFFDFTVTNQAISVPAGTLNIGDGSLQFAGQYNFDSGGNAEVQAEHLNLQSFRQDLPTTDISGVFDLREEAGSLTDPALYSNIRLTSSSVKNYTISNLEGRLALSNDTLRFVDSLSVGYKTAEWLLHGWYALNGELNLEIDVSTDRFDYLAKSLNLPVIYGEANGNFSIDGTIDTTSIDGRLQLRNFGFREFHFDTIAAYIQLDDIQRRRDGEMFVEAREGNAWGKEVAYGNLSAISQDDSVVIRNFELSDGDDHLYITGGISEALRGEVNKLELRYRNTFIHNRTPLPFQIENNRLAISQGVIGVNDGLVTFTGNVRSGDSLRTHAEFTNIDYGPLNQLLQDPLPVTGVLNGSFTYAGAGERQVIYSDLEIANVVWRDLHYQRIGAEIEYEDQVLTVNNGKIQTHEEGAISFTGQMPIDIIGMVKGDTIDFTKNLQFSSKLDLEGIYLEDYTQFIDINQSMSGLVSGTINLDGITADPNITFDLSVQHPVFDRIEGYHLEASGGYDSGTMEFTRLYLEETREGGIYQGSGTLPLTIDLYTPVIELRRDDPMDLKFHAETPQLQFLSKYMGKVDAVTGVFTLDLLVSGTPNNPERNGQITIDSSTVEVATLENEITGISGRGILRNNRMQLRDFTAKMHSPQDREIIEGVFQRFRHWVSNLFDREVAQRKPNLAVNGSLDFAHFFQPGLNLRIKGEDIYIRTLLGEIEGITGADMTLTGRDSLVIAGDLQPEEVVLRMSFSGNNIPQEIAPNRGEGRYVEYNLHTTFPGNFYIRNDQVSAEFEGDIWIVRHGDEPVNFSGQLNVIRGKYYYYDDTFTIQEGQIYFDPVEFNPRLNIVATTEIEDQVEVQLTLSGELDNPSINLETPGEGQRYTEQEILEILTFNERIEEGINTQALGQSIFTSYLEQQLENYGSQLIGLETFDVEAEGQGLQNLENVTITMGRRVAPNLYFTYGRGFFAENPTNTVGLEYQLNRYMSLLGEVDEEGLYHFKYRLKYNY